MTHLQFLFLLVIVTIVFFVIMIVILGIGCKSLCEIQKSLEKDSINKDIKVDKTFNIVINGDKFTVFKNMISYSEITKMVFGKTYPGCSITYQGLKSHGILMFDDKVKIEGGMIFNAVFTGNA